MFNMGVKSNHVTYNTLMHGYCTEGNLQGKLEVANDLLNKMLEKGLVPNHTTNDIIRVEMMEKGFIPNIEGHLCSFSGMC
ncbi:hypothetical protein L6164_023610 [Bauhinia variegata]|uniref:Uncharacterized protein n=1 Tax=Bauhinia variegata TaxID=167791 RepID=A0ACB9MIP5_BAUVA|nr:hypothetical protein L6164_023610 [Bauhinia variegata]